VPRSPPPPCDSPGCRSSDQLTPCGKASCCSPSLRRAVLLPATTRGRVRFQPALLDDDHAVTELMLGWQHCEPYSRAGEVQQVAAGGAQAAHVRGHGICLDFGVVLLLKGQLVRQALLQRPALLRRHRVPCLAVLHSWEHRELAAYEIMFMQASIM